MKPDPIIYEPFLDSWDDDSRELVHEDIGHMRLTAWLLSFKQPATERKNHNV